MIVSTWRRIGPTSQQNAAPQADEGCVVVGWDRYLGDEFQGFDQGRGGERSEPRWIVHQRAAEPEAVRAFQSARALHEHGVPFRNEA